MKTTVLLGTAAVCATLSTAPALAQIEEILVTAAKRSQSLSTLPTSATVFSGESLKELRVLDPKDLAEQTPGLLTKFGPNGLATAGFYLRGVGINDFTGTVDPSVALYVDEVFLPTPDMLNFAVLTCNGSKCCAAHKARSMGATALAVLSISLRRAQRKSLKVMCVVSTAGFARVH